MCKVGCLEIQSFSVVFYFRADMKMIEQEKASGFLPPLRPKHWRQKAMETLKQAVEDRYWSFVFTALSKF